MTKILVLNGPNLNLLGTREPDIYGTLTLEEIQKETNNKCPNGVALSWKQSNYEGDLVTWIQNAKNDGFHAIIINPAGYSHSSVSILDSMKSCPLPIVEVHLSNTHARESYRSRRITAKEANIIIEGLGKSVYYLAVISLIEKELI